jgi:hypothetical protein
VTYAAQSAVIYFVTAQYCPDWLLFWFKAPAKKANAAGKLNNIHNLDLAQIFCP